MLRDPMHFPRAWLMRRSLQVPGIDSLCTPDIDGGGGGRRVAWVAGRCISRANRGGA